MKYVTGSDKAQYEKMRESQGFITAEKAKLGSSPRPANAELEWVKDHDMKKSYNILGLYAKLGDWPTKPLEWATTVAKKLPTVRKASWASYWAGNYTIGLVQSTPQSFLSVDLKKKIINTKKCILVE